MSVEFYYPVTGTPTYSAVLKNPEYGNSETHNTNTVFHLTMNGAVFSYKKKTNQVLLLNFFNLTKTELDSFLTFYTACCGLVFSYLDQDGGIWHCSIMNSPLEYSVVLGLGNCELYNLTLQLNATFVEAATIVYLIDDEGNYLVDDEDNFLVAYGD